MSVFELSSTCRLHYEDPSEVHQAVTEFADLGDRHPEVQQAAFRHEGDTEHLTFVVEAGGPDEARVLAEALAEEIVVAIDARFGAGTLEPGEFQVTEAMMDDETVDALMSSLGLDIAELTRLASAVTDRPVVSLDRPGKAVPKKLREPLERHGLTGRGIELVLGRLVQAGEASVPEGPWTVRANRSEGPQRKTTVFTLEGLRFEVNEPDAVDLARDLHAELSGTGWSPVLLHEVTEWLEPEQGLRVTRTHEKDRTSIGFVPVEDDLDLLRFFGTDGASEELATEDVVERLREWRERSDLCVVAAGKTFAILAFQRLPEDVEAFAEEVYDFCPATVEQDYLGPETDDLREYEDFLEQQTVQDLAIFLGRERLLRLWWD